MQSQTLTLAPSSDVELSTPDQWELPITITSSPTPLPVDCGSGDGCGSTCASACVS